MAASERAAIRAQTLIRIGIEHAEMKLSEKKAKAHAGLYEELLSEIARLRTLPLKDVEPSMIFSPVQQKDDQGHG
jgi:hypothetical protein